VKKAWIQLLILLAVTFVFVPLVIENLLYRTLIGWGLSDIIAGNIAGVMIAAALLTAGYLTTRSDSKGSWKERVGLRSFDRSHFPFLIKLSLLSFVIGVACFLLSVWLGADLQNEKAKAVEESFAFFPLLVAFVGAVIISPIYEEIFYRGVMLSVLNRIASEPRRPLPAGALFHPGPLAELEYPPADHHQRVSLRPRLSEDRLRLRGGLCARHGQSADLPRIGSAHRAVANLEGRSACAPLSSPGYRESPSRP